MGDEESNNTDDELGADDGFDGGKLVVDIENAPVERTATKIIVPKELPASSIPSTATTSQHAVTAQVRPEAWNPGYRSSSSGPRSLFLRRSENGFGFTLRHFIVYPPESYAILAGDKRLGLRNGAVDEPMDTIFVKNVRENSPASEAGLTNGDRIVSVNGENIAGLPYAKVIQLIQKTGNYLHLSVVPKENDILQLYFGETAHNPETNRRPGFHLSDPSHFAVNLRDDDRQGSNGSSVRRYARRDTSPAYPGIGAYYPRESRTLSPSGVVPYGRRSSEGSNSQFKLTVPTLEYPSPMSHHHHQQFLSYPQGTSDSSSCGSSGAGDGMPSTYPCNTAGCRLSLDAGLMMSCTGTGSSRDSSCDSSGTTTTDLRGSDDSLMSRIRKSLEQKEEFLRRPAYSSSTATVPPPSQQNAERPAKELYAVPQKLTVPTWPPNNQQPSSPHPNHKQESSVVSCEIPSTTNKFKNKSTSFASTLDKIQENAIVTNVRMPADNNHNRNHGTAAQINAGENVVCPTSPFQLVTLRARQFESGVPCEDKTDLYRSELARLSSKKNVINVASRKREFESKAYTDRKAFAARESRSLDSQKNHRPLIARKLESSAPNDNKLKSSFNNAPPPHSDKRLINDNAVINSGTPPCRPNQLPLAVDFEQPVKLKTTELFFIDGEFVQVTRRNDDSTKDENDTTKPAISVDKVGNTDEDEKNKRRISYLKATSNDQMTVDSEYELSDSEIIGTAVVSASTISSAVAPLSSVLGSRKITGNGSVLSESEKENQAVIKEGSVLCKVTLIDGKKATDRSWKPVWLVLKGPILCVYKERRESLLSSHSETPAAFDRTDLGASCDRIDIRCSMVEVACDYTKRKHVFRLNAPSVGAELLLQTDDTASMTQWVKVLQEQALIPIDNQGIGSNVSPNVGNKTIKKLTYLRNRSPTGESPVTKTRKPTQTDQQQSSPKSKTWKNRMAKQFRRIQQGGNSPVSPTVIYPTGATIGIPLEICPSSTFSEYVPLLVEICTNIVEARGLEIIGIYRVPGNTAAVSSLTEAVNRGLDPSILDQDSRWQDVNVISSLLKSFFRRLPDSLLTSELYPHFIKADKIEDPLLRMTTIRKLLRNLPDHNYETLRYLMFHLKKIVNNSAVNKMEAKNLAIVFGPTLVRTSEDNMVTMVTDMSHQCRIVESLISHVDWCFGDSDVTELKVAIPDNSSAELEPSSTNHNLLLGNIRKVEGMQSPVTAKDIVSTIIGAANRKMQKAASKHSSTNRSKSTTSVITSSHHTSSNNNSEDTLDGAVISRTAEQRSSNSRNWINRENESKLLAAEFSEESRSSDSSLSNIPMQRETSSLAPESLLKPDSNVQSKSDDDSTNWTYAGLSATTQERIRRFEQETKAMLQRELTRQKRVVSQQEEENKDVRSGNRECENVFNIPVETEKKRISPDGLKEEKEIQVGEDVAPLVVNRRNLSAVNGNNVVISNSNKLVPNKKIKTGEEIMVSALPRSESLDSLHQSEHSSSRVSEESNDLLMSLTSTFDKKLKTLLMSEENEPVTKDKTFENGKKDNFFRDPSLHKSPDKQLTDDQENEKDSSEKENEPECKIVVENYDNNNGKNIRNGGRGDIGKINPEKILKFEHLINQNKSALSMQNSNSQKNGLGKESKLFYSNSVKVRRSDSFNKYHDGSGKLRRSGSLNKSDRLEQAKISKFESLILMKNAEAVKLKRSESLTKNEKTESNIMKRRQQEMRNSGSGSGPGGGKFLKDKEPKLKRKNGILKERNIKRRHTVGGTKDFDKSSWLDGKQKKNALEMNDSGRKERRTSSPDLSSSRLTDFLVEVIVRPRSFVNADPNFVSRLFNIPLESHV